MSPEAAPLGAVLCGGASRRMGTDKALVPVEGRPMAARVAEAVAAAGAEPVVAIGGDAARLNALGLEVIADREPGGGPVPALAIAAEVALDRGAERLVIAGCDHPWLLPETVEAMLGVLDGPPGERGAVVAVAAGGWPPPLVLAARPRELARAAGKLGPGTSFGHLLAAITITRVEVPAGPALADVDHPGDLDR